MTTKSYTTRTGKTQLKPVVTIDEVWAFDNAYEGFCLNCGFIRSECEPDARQYTCDSCNEPKVYGFMELAMMNLLEVTE
jgi:hypothetical protein